LRTGGRQAGVLLEREQPAITLLSQDLLVGESVVAVPGLCWLDAAPGLVG